MELSFLSSKEQTWLPGDDGSKLALIDYPEIRPGVVNIVHTEVDPGLGGQGIAGKLTQTVAEQLRREGRKAILTCSYAVKWFAKHPEYSDVLDDPEAEAQKAELYGGPACGIRRN